MLLYGVTDRSWTGTQSLYQQVESALKGGVTCIQLREKDLDQETFLKEAVELCQLCHQYHVPFIINDNVRNRHRSNRLLQLRVRRIRLHSCHSRIRNLHRSSV